MGCGIEPRKEECCGGRDARNRRRQYVRHRYARCRRSARVEGHITSKRNASEPERSHVRPQAAEPTGPHREGEEPKPMMHGHEKSDSAVVATSRRTMRGDRQRRRWSEGWRPRRTRIDAARAGHRAGKVTDFSESDNCNGSLAVGASCQISIILTPSSLNPETGSLELINNAWPTHIYVANLGGNGG